jgi:hypothetical protein
MAHSLSEQQRTTKPAKLEATKRKILGWNRFVDFLVGGLAPKTALVWAVLYRHATEGVVTRSNALLAQDINASDSTIRRAIAKLRQERLLKVVRQGGMHVGPSTYRLAVRNLRVNPAAQPDTPTSPDPAERADNETPTEGSLPAE